MQLVRQVEALRISAAWRSAKTGTETLSSKMHTCSTWAERKTALMVSLTAGILYSKADEQGGGTWQAFCHLLHLTFQRGGQLCSLLSYILQNFNCLSLLQVIIHRDSWKKRKIHWKTYSMGLWGQGCYSIYSAFPAFIIRFASPSDTWISVLSSRILYN